MQRLRREAATHFSAQQLLSPGCSLTLLSFMCHCSALPRSPWQLLLFPLLLQLRSSPQRRSELYRPAATAIVLTSACYISKADTWATNTCMVIITGTLK